MKQGSSISAGDAERLLRGERPSGTREQQVADVLAKLAPADAADTPVPAALLLAFAQQASTDHAVDHAADQGPDHEADLAANDSRHRRAQSRRTGARGRQFGVRGWHFGRSAALKAAVAILAVSCGTVGAAEADVLPAAAQRAAHSLLGSFGVPAPHTAAVTPKVSTTPTPAASFAPTSAVDAAPPTASQSASTSASASASPSCSAPNTHAATAADHCTTSATASTSTSTSADSSSTATATSTHTNHASTHTHTASPHNTAAH